jgi:lysophospholipase L1-like esterase/plastocyanin
VILPITLALFTLTVLPVLIGPVALPTKASTGDGSPADTNIKYIGRWDTSDLTNVKSYWSGAYFRVNVTGTSVSIRLAAAANIFASVDGVTTYYASANGTINLTPTALPAGTHSLQVIARSEQDVIQFQGLTLSPGATTQAPTIKSKLIEFVGDSITAGCCALPNWSMDDYAWLTAENLIAEHTQIAYSGICLQDATCGENNIGMSVQFFKLQTIHFLNSPNWDFSRYQADQVVINIGTNDGAVADSTFQATYTTFLQNVRAKYPAAQIFVLRTFGGYKAVPTSAAVDTRIAAGDTKVHFVDTTGWLTAGSSDFSDSLHPSVSGNIKAADRLTAVLSAPQSDISVYTLADNFSSTQGQSGWRYQQTPDGVTYSDLTWQSSTNQWLGACAYNLIWAPSQIHPDCNDTVVTWVAPKVGLVRITGNPRKQYAAGDGVNVKVLQNASQLWPASGWQFIAGTDTTGVNHNLTTTVAAGDTVRFVVNRNVTATSDETNWNPSIQYADPNTFMLSANFSSIQGWNNWRYQQTADGVNFTDMTWTPPWKGACTYNAIWAPSQIHPDCNDSVVTWVAPRAGPVRITGNPRKQASGGDGVNVKILQNALQLWPASGWQFIAGTDTIGVTHNLTITVAAGDNIRFVVNRNVTITSDETNWNPTIQYADPNTFTLSASFSATTQGWNGWRYQQTADGVNFTDLAAQSSGPWQGACAYNLIWAPSHIHPDCNDTVVAWFAPKAGPVRITGNPRKQYAAGDGVQVKILQNGAQVWPASGWQFIGGSDTTGVVHNLTINVAMGDAIRFVVNRNVTATSDETNWNPTIQYADPNTFTLSTNFSATTQGWDGWRYQQTADGVTFSDLTATPSGTWQGACAYNLVWAPSQIHPDCNDTVVTWIAPRAGQVAVTGNPRKQYAAGDGVQVKVLQNSMQIWPASGWQFIAGTDTTGVTHNLTITVVAGDAIRFIVNRNVTITSDETNWNPTIHYI